MSDTRVTPSPSTRHGLTRRRQVVASIKAARAARGAAARAEGPSAVVRRPACRAALGNNAKSTATAGQGTDDSRRASRYKARAWLSTIRTAKIQQRWAACGKTSVVEGGEVGLRLSPGTSGKGAAGLSGLSTCGSVWACPVCSAKIASRRTQEIEKLLAWNAARGGSVALATFTMSHNTRDRLKALRKALSGAWKHMVDHRVWKETRKKLGMDGYVRAIECTHTNTGGWHLHIHVLMVFDGPVSTEMVSDWSDELYELWSDGLAKNDMTASRERGVDVRVGTGALDGLGKYLSKLTYETAGGRFKKGKKSADGIVSRTPFELLDDFINNGLADDLDAWEEWERDSKGMRQLGWSQGLKKRVEVDEIEDEQIAEDEAGGETLLMISARSWKEVYWSAAELLTATEQGGRAGAYAWLDARGLIYERIEDCQAIHGPALPSRKTVAT